ncbi:MAG TPA: winged helix-turn-helix domain-containing protein [Bryobacteraceae bacterium]|nr:winged helix-turn-helix domain-containing protein [Bryobacteraceae bacterium]
MSTRRFRFGTFEFDGQARELRREGAAVRLQAQPAAVLGALLDRAGELVTREELREVVWGKDTNVDFESGLNYCVAQLRSALGDSADSPVYVKTAPKRGYQFVAPVTVVGAAAETSAVAAPFRWRNVAAAAVAIVAVCGAAWYGWQRVSGAGSVRIAVARFENQSGDAGMDRFTEGLSDALVAELATTPLGTYQVIGNAVSLRGPRARQDLARIAEELRAQYIVLGQVQGKAGAGRVLVHLIRLPDQAHLWVTRVENPDYGDAVRTQKEIARRTVRDLALKLNRSGG